MLSGNPRSDKFFTKLPANFFKASISQKYNNYIGLQNSYFKTIDQIVNESIQSLEIPGLSQDLIEQTTSTGSSSSGAVGSQDITQYPDVKPLEQALQSNTISITFRHLDSYINYFYLMELWYNLYLGKTKESRFTMPVTCLNTDGVPVFNIIFSKCLFKSIPSITLGFDSQVREFKSFACEFTFSDFSVEFDLPQGLATKYKTH